MCHWQPQRLQQPYIAPLSVDLPVYVDRVKLVGKFSSRFAGAQKKIAVCRQAKMEQRHYGLLGRRFEIDQEVPARYQMHLRERCILDDVVGCKNDELSQIL